jgi:hypothetical protein
MAVVGIASGLVALTGQWGVFSVLLLAIIGLGIFTMFVRLRGIYGRS